MTRHRPRVASPSSLYLLHDSCAKARYDTEMKNQHTICTLLKYHGTVRYSNPSLASSKVLPTINAYLKKSGTIKVIRLFDMEGVNPL
jgi:hypothetical protein